MAVLLQAIQLPLTASETCCPALPAAQGAFVLVQDTILLHIKHAGVQALCCVA